MSQVVTYQHCILCEGASLYLTLTVITTDLIGGLALATAKEAITETHSSHKKAVVEVGNVEWETFLRSQADLEAIGEGGTCRSKFKSYD